MFMIPKKNLTSVLGRRSHPVEPPYLRPFVGGSDEFPGQPDFPVYTLDSRYYRMIGSGCTIVNDATADTVFQCSSPVIFEGGSFHLNNVDVRDERSFPSSTLSKERRNRTFLVNPTSSFLDVHRPWPILSDPEPTSGKLLVFLPLVRWLLAHYASLCKGFLALGTLGSLRPPPRWFETKLEWSNGLAKDPLSNSQECS